jgi:hypothetical protein
MSPAKKLARKVFREWCAANGIVIYPMAGADLVARIEAALEQVAA